MVYGILWSKHLNLASSPTKQFSYMMNWHLLTYFHLPPGSPGPRQPITAFQAGPGSLAMATSIGWRLTGRDRIGRILWVTHTHIYIYTCHMYVWLYMYIWMHIYPTPICINRNASESRWASRTLCLTMLGIIKCLHHSRRQHQIDHVASKS